MNNPMDQHSYDNWKANDNYDNMAKVFRHVEVIRLTYNDEHQPDFFEMNHKQRFESYEPCIKMMHLGTVDEYHDELPYTEWTLVAKKDWRRIWEEFK